MDNETIKSNVKRIIDKARNQLRFHSIEFLSGEYVYPCEVETLRSHLLGESEVVKVEDHFLRTDTDFLKNHELFKSLIENGYFNPYKHYRLCEYFIITKTFDDLNILYTFHDEPVLKRNIVHVGEKGSGKTALQNCWLKENNKTLEEKGIFWVRCDGHKLYRLWLNHKESLKEGIDNTSKDSSVPIQGERLVNIEEYLDIQLIYVFAKYCLSEDRDFLNYITRRL